MFDNIKTRTPVEQSFMASVSIQGAAVLLFAVLVQIVIQGSGMAAIPTLIAGIALLRIAQSPDDVMPFSTVLYAVAFVAGLVFLLLIPEADAPNMLIPSLTYFHFKILYLLVTGGTLVHSYFVLLEVEGRGGPI